MFLPWKGGPSPNWLSPDAGRPQEVEANDLNNVNSSQVTVVKEDGECDVILAIGCDVAKSKWVMDYIAFMQVCRERSVFEDLESKVDHGHIKLANGQKVKLEGAEVSS